MRGETSMARMITGALFVIKQLSAMRLATMNVENYPMVMLTSRQTSFVVAILSI
jgi:hypothetical protein